jgi:hypothetical protein
MKKFALIIFVICVYLPVRAQFRFGIQGGLNVTTQIAKNYTADYAKNEFLAGFNVGPTVDYTFSRHFSLHTALILENKGTRGQVRISTISADVMNRLLYLDVPLLARWNFTAGNTVLFVEAGGYAGYGLKGKAKIETADTSKTWDIKWGDGPQDDFKRFDYGLTGGAGLEWKRFSVEGCLNYGLANIYALSQTGYVIKQRAFSFRIGYYLNSKEKR